MHFFQSFREKIAASVIGLIVVLQTSSSWYGYYRMDQVLVQAIQKETVNSASSLMSLFQDKTSSLDSLDEKRGFLDAYAGLIGAVRFPALLQEQANLKDVYFVNVKGEKISSTAGAPTPVIPNLLGLVAKQQLGAMEGQGYVSIFVPLADSQGALGGFVFTYSDALITQERQYSLLITAILIAVFSVVGGAAVLIITSAVTKPIRLLVEGSQMIASGNLDKVIDVKGDDEIATLAQSFEAMRASLKESRHIQEEYSGNLEKTVQARTDDLNQKMIELEHMNKVMIGREMKMIELKREVEELKKGSGGKTA